MVNTPNTEVVHVTRIYKQHKSLTTTIPLCVRQALGVKITDWIIWSVDVRTNTVKIEKLVREDPKNG